MKRFTLKLSCDDDRDLEEEWYDAASELFEDDEDEKDGV